MSNQKLLMLLYNNLMKTKKKRKINLKNNRTNTYNPNNQNQSLHCNKLGELSLALSSATSTERLKRWLKIISAERKNQLRPLPRKLY